MPSFDLGESIPPDTAHAVSVSLPTWRSNVGYEEGEAWVVDRMTTGYPRFFVHRSIQRLAEKIVSAFGGKGQTKAILLPTPAAALRCRDFIARLGSEDLTQTLAIVDLSLEPSQDLNPLLRRLWPTISAVLYPDEATPLAKQYWQHTGDGVSSRRAEFCKDLFEADLLIATRCGVRLPVKQVDVPQRPSRGPKRYQRPGSVDALNAGPPRGQSPPDKLDDVQESSTFLEERFGRNLDLSLVERARMAIRRRIAGTLTHDVVDLMSDPFPTASPSTRGIKNLTEDDVFLYPCGMNAIFNAHRALLRARGDMKSINFGFPYVDTLKILQKFGPGCQFYGRSSGEDLDDLERLLQGGQRFLALFCEFPGNPLLTCPDLDQIRQLADEFDFAVVVDETIGTFANVNVLQVADVVVSSLTKVFSGDSNVMGGAAILNPESKYYSRLKQAMCDNWEDSYWPEDIVFMERNSRDYTSRVSRINANGEAISDLLINHPLVKTIYYPKYVSSRSHYEVRRLPNGGYGGLLSIVFHQKASAQAFFDALAIAKGPSLGTNFTLGSPYVLLAHYTELPWAAAFGVDPDLVRISVGLEETAELVRTFEKALAAVTSKS